MIFCGERENVFLNMMKKINKYGFDQDGKLNLMLNDVAMMRFKKWKINEKNHKNKHVILVALESFLFR
jgi:hypothetical protein